MEDEQMDVDLSSTTVENLSNSESNNDQLKQSSTLDELINSENMQLKQSNLPPRWENKGGTFTTGIDIFSADEKLKMKERAKRFGIDKELNDNNPANDEEIIDETNLYKSMKIIEDIDNKKIRLNALHMRGTSDMSTNDVFKYFQHYGPSTIEWINDESCNIIWLDNLSASRALIHLSKKINYQDDNNDDDDKKTISPCKNNLISLNDINCSLPPGVWRKGNDYKKINNIFLRFATINDKKKANSEKQSEYYKKYGNPNFGGVKGLLTESHKKLYKQKKRKLSDVIDDDDDKKKNPWGELSENWGNTDNFEEYYVVNKRPNLRYNYDNNDGDDNDGKTTIKNRLGLKNNHVINNGVDDDYLNKSDDNCTDDSSDDENDDDMSRRSKVPRMRMHADDEEEKVKRKKLKQIHQKKREESRDLRLRIGRRKSPIYRDKIQVIVTNQPEIYKQKRPIMDIEREMMEESEKEEGELEDEVNEGGIGGDNELEEDVVEMRTDDDEEEEEEGEIEEETEDSSTSDSDLSEKEVQGPKGSVIKVVARAKPQVASTVWTRLNFNADKKNNSTSSNNRGNVSDRLKGDLRSRIGNQNKRERSPLRIEVKNEKYEGQLEQDYSD